MKRSINLSDKLRKGEDVGEEIFQTTFLDEEADRNIINVAYKNVGEGVKQLLEFGLFQLMKELKTAGPKIRSALFSDEALIRLYYHFDKTFKVFNDFLEQKGLLSEHLSQRFHKLYK
jgi:hypothetical protein